MFLINGAMSCTIDVSDRGFQYGDGLFETIEIDKGRLVFFDRHIRRLNEGCRRLQIPLEDTGNLVAEAENAAKDVDRGVLKIILTRGTGGRGYRQPDSIKPTRVISVYPFPDYPENYTSNGITARICSTRLGLNPALAGIKHLNRLEQILARAEWNDPGIQEGLMLDADGNVIEGTMTNLFYVINRQLRTSETFHSGVAGIMREIILELAESNALVLSKRYFGIDELLNADEIFVCNSVIGLWPVTQIDGKPFAVGPVTREITAWLEQYKKEWLQAC
ncbi:aminodeoxychorismate lyase [Methylotuvimicrobium sp. KM1]|uniref:aminodeoxychorismate lyase n=1 Tax=Methylotuvimicrobium sp. KM1 TaxID=3377707 RepID=UPI00384F9899